MTNDTGTTLTAVEEIQAAIQKLTAQRAAAVEGPWDNSYGELSGKDYISVVDMEVRCGSYCQGGTAQGVTTATGDLIATLHATIDAQLALLGDSLVRRYGDTGLVLVYLREYIGGNALTLARAINGTA